MSGDTPAPLGAQASGGPRVDGIKWTNCPPPPPLIYYLMSGTPRATHNLGKELIMSATDIERSLHAHVRDLINNDPVMHESYSEATGYASVTGRLENPDDWAEHPGVQRRMADILRWAEDHGFNVNAVEPTDPPTFAEAVANGQYHPDLLPMMERISAAAENASYCSEYDRMARVVGAPTRAEVRRLVAERDGQAWKVQVPVVVYLDIDVPATAGVRSADDAKQYAFNNVTYGPHFVSQFADEEARRRAARNIQYSFNPALPSVEFNVPYTAEAQ